MFLPYPGLLGGGLFIIYLFTYLLIYIYLLTKEGNVLSGAQGTEIMTYTLYTEFPPEKGRGETQREILTLLASTPDWPPHTPRSSPASFHPAGFVRSITLSAGDS